MRITQAYVPSPLHAREFYDKFNVGPYTDVNAPTCFFGAHVSILDKIRKHKGHLTLIWIGMDAYNMSIGKHDVELVRRCRNIATSRSIQYVLDANRVENEYYPISCFKFEGIEPVPLGDKIYFYYGRKDLYQYDLMKRVEERILNEVVWVNGWQGHTREDIFKIYESCFCGVRLRNIDGFSNTGIELGLLGRVVIHNGDAPNNVHYAGEDDLVEKILAPKPDVNKVSREMRQFIDIGDKWLYV
jgi:hypothetical protein